MAKNAVAGPGSIKPGCQNRKKYAGAGPRVNLPSLYNRSFKINYKII